MRKRRYLVIPAVCAFLAAMLPAGCAAEEAVTEAEAAAEAVTEAEGDDFLTDRLAGRSYGLTEGIPMPQEVNDVMEQLFQGFDTLVEGGRDIYHDVYGEVYDYKEGKTRPDEITAGYREHPSATVLLFMDRCLKGGGENASKLYFGMTQSRDFGTLIMVDRQGTTTVYTGPITEDEKNSELSIVDVVTGESCAVKSSMTMFGDYRLETVSGFGDMDGKTYNMEKAYAAELAVVVSFADNYPESYREEAEHDTETNPAG